MLNESAMLLMLSGEVRKTRFEPRAHLQQWATGNTSKAGADRMQVVGKVGSQVRSQVNCVEVQDAPGGSKRRDKQPIPVAVVAGYAGAVFRAIC